MASAELKGGRQVAIQGGKFACYGPQRDVSCAARRGGESWDAALAMLTYLV